MMGLDTSSGALSSSRRSVSSYSLFWALTSSATGLIGLQGWVLKRLLTCSKGDSAGAGKRG